MNKYDLIKRFKNMIEEERALQLEESLLKKAAIDFYTHLNNTAAVIYDENIKRPSKKQLLFLEEQNKNLEFLIGELENDIERYKLESASLQSKNEELIKTQADKIICLAILKETTNVFLNTKALPTAVKGLNVCCVEQNEQWNPFTFPIENLTQEQITERFWHTTENLSDYRQQWEELILGKNSLN